MSSARAPRRRTSQERLRQARAQIAQIEFICSGTLFHRTKMCGKPNCACATDPKARHGPYFEWSRRQGDRQVHTAVPPAVAKAIARGIRNQRHLRRLLRLWEQESIRVILEDADRKSR
jgi:hypothetical protein